MSKHNERPTPRTERIMDNIVVAMRSDTREQSIAHFEEAKREIETLERELTAALERAAINARDWQRQCLKTDDAERELTESRTRIMELESDVTRISRERDTALSDLEFRRGLYSVLEGRYEALREGVGKCHDETREVLASVEGGSDERHAE